MTSVLNKFDGKTFLLWRKWRSIMIRVHGLDIRVIGCPSHGNRSLSGRVWSGLVNIHKILILDFPKFVRTFYEIYINKCVNYNIQQYVCAEKTVKLLTDISNVFPIWRSTTDRWTNYQTTLLWYILNQGLRQIQMSIFLGRWLESCGLPS